MQAFTDYMRKMFEEKRRNFKDDLVSALVRAEEAGDKLSEDELLSMVFLLLIAEHETAVDLISNGMLALPQHPDQLERLRMIGISKSQVSKLCEELDEEVRRFRTGPSEGPYFYVWLNATYLKSPPGRASGLGGGSDRRRGEKDQRAEVLDLDVGPSEDGAFWLSLLRSLVARCLSGVRLVVSDAYRGLEGDIEAVQQGAGWKRCRVHFMRNALSLVLKGA